MLFLGMPLELSVQYEYIFLFSVSVSFALPIVCYAGAFFFAASRSTGVGLSRQKRARSCVQQMKATLEKYGLSICWCARSVSSAILECLSPARAGRWCLGVRWFFEKLWLSAELPVDRIQSRGGGCQLSVGPLCAGAQIWVGEAGLCLGTFGLSLPGQCWFSRCVESSSSGCGVSAGPGFTNAQ